MMDDWILLMHCEYDKAGIRKEIKQKTDLGKLYLTLLIETHYGSFHTVTATYYDGGEDELYMLEHPICNFTLDDVKRYSVLKVFD